MRFFDRRSARAALLLIFTCLSAAVAVGQSSSAGDEEWYVGGNLHGATVLEWHAASHANRLATAGDWATGVLGADEVRRIGLTRLKGKAEQLVTCINESTRDLDGVDAMVAREIAAACAVLMNW